MEREGKEENQSNSLNGAEIGPDRDDNNGRGRNLLLQHWFQFKLQQYKVDESIGPKTAVGLLSVYFICTSMGTTDWDGVETQYIRYEVVAEVGLIFRSLVLIFILTNLVLLVTGFFLTSRTRSHPSLVIKGYCWTKYFVWYIGLPVMVWSYAPALTGHKSQILGSDPGMLIYGWISVLLAFFLAFVGCLFRSHLPTKGKLNTPNKLMEPMIYFFQLITIIVRGWFDKGDSEYIFDIASMGVTFLLIILCWYEQVFWWRTIDHFFFIGHMVVLSIRVAVVTYWLLTASKTAFPYMVFSGLLSVITAKLAHNLLNLRAALRVKYIGIASEYTRFVTVMSTKLANESFLIFSDTGNIDSILFHQNQVGRENSLLKEKNRIDNFYNSSDKEQEERLEKNGKPASHDLLWAYYMSLWYNRSRKPEELKQLLFLQIVYLDTSLMRVSFTLSTLRKILGDQSNRSFDMYLLEAILAARLQTKSKADGNQDSRMVWLSELLQDISHDNSSVPSSAASSDDLEQIASENNRGQHSKKYNSYSRFMRGYGKKSSRVHLEIASILDNKNKYLVCMAQTSKLIGTKLDLYSSLYETSNHKSNYVYMQSSRARELARAIDKMFLEMANSPKVPTYALASAVSYFLKVRFDIQKSEHLFKMYRAKISKFQGLAAMRYLEITQHNFDYNVVAFRISVSLDQSLGQIEDISMNYQEHLGEPIGGDPTHVNINTLFPGVMADAHLKMMKGLDNQDIFNSQRNFQINGFDGFLRPIGFVLKIDSSIQNGIHALGLLRFSNNSRCQLVLVDERLSVLAADRKFRKIMQAFGSEVDLTNIRMLSEGLAVQIQLHKFLNYLHKSSGLSTDSGLTKLSSAQAVPSSVNAVLDAMGPDSNTEEAIAKEFVFNRQRQRVLEYYTQLVQDGVQHHLNHQFLNLPELLQGLPLVAKIEETWFGTQRFYRIWCSFDFNHNEDTRRLLNDHQLDELKSNEGLNIEFGDAMRMSKSKETDTDSKNGAKKYHVMVNNQQNSLKSEKQINGTEYMKGINQRFSNILHKLKANTPFLELLAEAQKKQLEPEIKEAFEWLLTKSLSFEELADPTPASQLQRGLPDTPVTPVVIRSVHEKAHPDKQQIGTDGTAFNFSDAGMPIAKGLPNSTVATHEQLRKALKEAAMPTLQQTGTHVTENLKTENSVREGVAYVIPVTAQPSFPEDVHARITHMETASMSQTGPMKSFPQPEQPFNKAGTVEEHISIERDRDRQSRDFAKKGGNGNADSTTALLAKESKDSLFEDKEIRITKIPLVRGDKRESINKVFPTKKAQSAHITNSPQTSINEHTMKNSKTVSNTPKAKAKNKEKVFAQTKTQSPYEAGGKSSIWKLSRLSRVFKKAPKDQDINLLRKKEQVTTTYITTVSRGEAFVSHSQFNLNLISRYITEYKGIRKNDVAPDDKNQSVSVSTKSASSKGAYLLKMVHNTLETKRNGSLVYILTLGLFLFTVFFAISYQTTISGLKTYNQTNQDSFFLVTKFINFERRLVEGVELQEMLYEHAYVAWNPTTWNFIKSSYQRVLPGGLNSTSYLMKQLSDAVSDITVALQEIILYTTSLSSRSDAGNINGVVFQNQNLNYWERRYQIATNSSTPYITWSIPYFSIIEYYNELLKEGRDTLLGLLSAGLRTDGSLPSSNQDLTLMFKMKYGLTTTVYNGMLNNLGVLFDAMTQSIVINTVNQHFKSVYILIYVGIAATVIMLIYGYWIFLKVNEMHQQHLESFVLLKPWELMISIEDNEYLENLFTKYAFHEVQLINQYLDLGLYSQMALFNNRMLKLEQKHSKDKEKTGGFKFVHNFRFLTSKIFFSFVVLNMLIFGLLCVTVVAFLSMNDRRLGVEQTMYDAHSNLIEVQKYYLTPLVMMLYGYYVNIGGINLRLNAYNQTYDNFLQFLTRSRTNYIQYFDQGDLSTIEGISFGDICGMGRSYLLQDYGNQTVDFYQNCRTDNNASTTRGIFGFLQYEQNIIDRVRNLMLENYKAFLTNSSTALPTRPQTNLLFYWTLVQQRLGHRTVIDLYYRILEQLTVKNIQKITAQLEYAINEVLQSVSVILYLLMIAFYGYFLFMQARELDNCYEAYKLIDPYFLMNNRYLHHRFKSAFQGHS